MHHAQEPTPSGEISPLGRIIEKRSIAVSGEVVDDMGYALGAVQYGGTPASSKPWKGLGPGVREIVEDDAAGTYRAVYTVRFAKAVYVLHAFQKKSPSGIRRARTDVDLIERRLRAAREHYEERYGKEA
jgi:phage-related protein